MYFQGWTQNQGTIIKGVKLQQCILRLERTGLLRRHPTGERELYIFETRPGRIKERIHSIASAQQPGSTARRRGGKEPASTNESGSNGRTDTFASREFVERDRGGIEITRPIEFPCTRLNSQSTVIVSIVNTGRVARSLLALQVLGETSANSFAAVGAFPLVIPPNQAPVTICINFRPSSIGVSKALLGFSFTGFMIGRYISATSGDPDVQEHLKPTAPYRKRERRRIMTASSRIVDGENVKVEIAPYVRPMGPFPRRLTSLEDIQILKDLPADFDEISPEEYRRKHKLMLAIEESHLEDDIQQYNMPSAVLRKSGVYLILAVPGLAEKRPSVLRGDFVICTLEGVDYRGYVHMVQMTDVFLKFSKSFHAIHVDRMHYDIKFVFPRRTMRILLQALSFTKSSEFKDSASVARYHRLLFPREQPPSIIEAPALSSFLVADLNTCQKRAVNNIIWRIGSNLDAGQQSSRNPFADENPPYIIFGPPGTGKTKTVVEAVYQACRYRFQGSSLKILVCAPSNTAADVLLNRLAPFLNNRELLRFMSFTRSRGEVSNVVHDYCNFDSKLNGYVCPSAEKLNSYQVVVATCGMAGKLFNNGLARDHFDVVFADESGHAWESEILAPSSFPLKRTGVLVLAGDSMQLGPVTHSDTDLNVSMLERLLKRPLYLRDDVLFPDTGGFDARFVTKLLETYRCHPEIIKIPNELFYENDLIDRSGLEARSLLRWDCLLNPEFPLIFHGVAGENQREENSPSWFNPSEVEQVLHYIQLLMEQARVLASDIGIIAPYQKQVKKIRIGLRLKGLDASEKIAVGSCEQFQGQEKRVIIVSTVRTSKELIAYDSRFHLGFVSNSKRMNVAMTRAKALLIVVGDPNVLAEDRHWWRLLKHCYDNGAYTGAPFNFQRNDMSSVDDNIARALSQMKLSDEEEPPPYDGGETKEF